MVSEGCKRHVVRVRVQRSRFASLLFVLLLAPVSELATDGGQISFGECADQRFLPFMTLLVRSLAKEETDEVTEPAAEIHENSPPAPPEQPLDGSVTEGWRTDSTDLGFPMASEPGASIASGIKGWFSRRDSNTEAEKEKVAASFTNDDMKTAAATGQPPDIKRSPTDVKMPDSTEVVGEQLRAATDFGLPIAEPRVGDANAYLIMSNGSG
eukprot:CAMPEP_0198226876 /NCGR_PEP_ID=MMETSP1445-20131203/106956_1 /TAXON_ID=36898 /ORGANISM="Pyramimonas sp., Strain CCMP2087" /LENGTH=210 /DNA_ID=CAMNT_0043906783 /DNA_START=128 /DNA_END=757 /DNA_ORIENTATION=-